MKTCCILSSILIALFVAMPVAAQCPARPPLFHYTSSPGITCVCFIPGEEGGATFTPPAADYPLEVISASFFWSAGIPGGGVLQEQAIHLYNAGLPNPGVAVASIPGPMLTDGVLNTFPFAAPVPIASGPISVTLEFLNQNAGGGPFAPSMTYDLDGCQAGLNLVKAIPGGWSDACALGVTGDWVVEIVYRPCQGPVPVERMTWGQLKKLSTLER
jgi:hypothetical protein